MPGDSGNRGRKTSDDASTLYVPSSGGTSPARARVDRKDAGPSGGRLRGRLPAGDPKYAAIQLDGGEQEQGSQHYGSGTVRRSSEPPSPISTRALRIVVLIEVLHALEAGDGLVRHAGDFGLRGDRLVGFQVVGGQLHDAAAGVGHQDIVLAALGVDDHVDGLVAIAQLGDGGALHLVAGLEFGDRECAPAGCRCRRRGWPFRLDLVRHEGAHRRVGLEAAVRAVPDLDPGALAGGLEGERNAAQAGGELFVGEAGDQHLAIDVLQLGDGLHALPVLLRLIEQGDGHVLDVGERNFGELAARGGAQDHGNGIGAASARDRDVDVLRDRVDDDVLNQDLVGGRAEHGGDLLVDALDFEAGAGFRRRAVVHIEGDDRAADGVADEEDAVGSHGERAGGFEFDFTRRHVDAGGETESGYAARGCGKPEERIRKAQFYPPGVKLDSSYHRRGCPGVRC